jgi:inorganic pyrophosphatase
MAFPSPFYRWRPHPWHGLEIGPNPPQVVHAFIEICPFDLVKYEVDKVTGYSFALSESASDRVGSILSD